MAISETTRVERSQVWLEAPVPVLTPSLRLSVRLVRKAANAGARLHSAPVAKASSRANAATPAVDGDGVDARHGFGQQVQGGADGDRGKCQAQQATGQAEQQAFENRFAEDDAGTRAQSQANGVFATPADGPHQQQTRRH
jgi:hypothetical protein